MFSAIQKITVLNISYLLVKFQWWNPLLLNWETNLVLWNILLCIRISFENFIKMGPFNLASNNLSRARKKKKRKEKRFNFSIHVNFLSGYLFTRNKLTESKNINCETFRWKRYIDIPRIPIWWCHQKLRIFWKQFQPML